jgi:glutathione S-transferase
MAAAPGTARIFHLLPADAWVSAVAEAVDGRPTGPVAVDQFERHGFVHCCFREQLVEIATWWFDAGDELLALELDPAGLPADLLRLEASPSRWYPHLYAPIDPAAIVDVHVVSRSAGDGVAELPSALRKPPPGFQVGDGTGRLVQWQAGTLTGDPSWIADAEAAIAEGRPVPLIGGVVGPATSSSAYEAFALLELVAGGITRYDGDGFFPRD